MADADAALPTPPPEVVAPEEHPVGAESTVAAPAEVDNKRKLEEVSADAEVKGTSEDAKRPRVDGEPDAATGVEQQIDGSSVNADPAAPEDKAALNVGAAMDGDNNTPAPAPAPDSQAVSDEKPLEAAAEAPQQEGDAATAVQEISRKIEVPNSKVGVVIGKAGETIRNLQISSGAKIQITKDIEADSNALTRPVELVGTPGSVDKAEQLIKSVIAEAEAGGSPALIARGFGSGQPGSEQFEMTVPDNKVGLIIGKGGETIKGMQTKSGARIQLIPQHPPEGVTLTERIVRVTGNKKQIEAAKDLIKQAMNQTFSKHTNQSGGYGPQGYRPQGHGAASQLGPRSQNHGYGYPPRGMPPPQNYNAPYGGYPPQGPSRGGMGWDQRPGPPTHPSYQGGGSDYYKQGSQPYDSQPPSYPPGPGNYNSYGQSQGPNYGQPQYPQHAPQQNYSHGYGDPRYNAPPPNQQYYGQPPMAPQQGYPQQPDPYARPPYSGPGQWTPRGAPAADGSYQAPPSSYGPPSQQPPAYGQTYGAATGPDGYGQQGYPQQGGQVPASYGQSAPAAPGYPQQGTQQGGYAQYPQTQPAYGDQAAQPNANYGYQGAPADPNYGSAYPQQPGYGPPGQATGQAGYASSAPAASQPVYGQAGYTQPPTNPPSYDQSAAPAATQSGYAAPPANPQQPAAAKGVSPQPAAAAAAGYGASGQWTA
uniref:K Homology domain-containing protein n=1 Tax=Zea mays TaxID=4577 RepID=B8A0M3_MAIZE|nr:unknown [Zea mays]